MYKIEDMYFYHGFLLKRQVLLENKWWGCWAYYRSGGYTFKASLVYFRTLRECKEFVDNINEYKIKTSCGSNALMFNYVDDIMFPIYKKVEPDKFIMVKSVKCKCFEIVEV